MTLESPLNSAAAPNPLVDDLAVAKPKGLTLQNRSAVEVAAIHPLSARAAAMLDQPTIDYTDPMWRQLSQEIIHSSDPELALAQFWLGARMDIAGAAPSQKPKSPRRLRAPKTEAIAQPNLFEIFAQEAENG